jgi:hypothetical protein
MYKEPWQGLNKFPLHLQPPGYDMPEFICSPIDFADYKKQVEGAVLPSSEKK